MASQSDAVIRDDAPSHKSVPYEQNNQRADDGANKSGDFMWIIPAGGITNKSCNDCPGDAEHGGENKTFWRFRTGHKQARDGAGNKTD
jgi:hypothetical protein